MLCNKFGLLKIGIYFDYQKKEFRFYFLPCCWKFNYDTSFSISARIFAASIRFTTFWILFKTKVLSAGSKNTSQAPAERQSFASSSIWFLQKIRIGILLYKWFASLCHEEVFPPCCHMHNWQKPILQWILRIISAQNIFSSFQLLLKLTNHLTIIILPHIQCQVHQPWYFQHELCQ